MFRRIAITAAALAAAALLVAAPRPASAGSATADLVVTATVKGVCTIDAANLSFSTAYDPAANLDAYIGDIRIRCTSGTGYRVDLGPGSHPSGTTRQMAGGASEFLQYELYSDSAYGIVWGSGTTGTIMGLTGTTPAGAAGVNPYSLPVYARVFAGQPVSVGTYTDTVHMTVNF